MDENNFDILTEKQVNEINIAGYKAIKSCAYEITFKSQRNNIEIDINKKYLTGVIIKTPSLVAETIIRMLKDKDNEYDDRKKVEKCQII